MTHINIHFAGTGDAFNTDGLANQAIVIETESQSLLVDAGPTALHQMMTMGLQVGKITHIFISHFHGDHTAGLPFLMLTFQRKIKPRHLPVIIGPIGIHRYCKQLFEACYAGSGLDNDICYHEFPSSYQKNIEIDRDISIDIFPMKHSEESIAYRFYVYNTIIAVSGDTGFNDNLIRLVDGADAAIIECSSVYPEVETHTSLQDVKRHIDRMNCTMIIPVHTTQSVLKEIYKWGHEKIHPVGDGETVRL
jgi:ribonuclease BN (tRNA processing enzyme)